MNQILKQQQLELYKTLASDLTALTENLPPARSKHGICNYLTPGVEYEFQAIAQHWPKHSGNDSYPIGKDSVDFALHQSSGTLWSGEQLGLRLELIDFVLTKLRDNYL